MAASYPGAIYSVPSFGTNMADVQIHSTWRTNMIDEMRAVQLELGTHPSGAYSTVAARFAALHPAAVTATGLTLGPITGESTTCTLNLPAQTVPGQWVITGKNRIVIGTPTANNIIQTQLKDGGVAFAIKDSDGAATRGDPVFVEFLPVAASTAKTITMTVQRSTGAAATAATVADARFHRLQATFFPSV